MIRIYFIFILLFPTKTAVADPLSFFGESQKSAVAVQTFRIRPYDQVVSGFETSFEGKVQTICICDDSNAAIFSQIEKKPYDIVLSVGLKALTKVLFIKETPIIYLMVLDPPEVAYAKHNIFGISMTAHPEVQLAIIRKTMPWVQKIGILYGSHTAGLYVQLAKHAAKNKSLVLVDQKTADPRQFVNHLKKMTSEIDIFWMIPDIETLTSENIELLLLMSVENKKPILTFSEKFVELGAFMAISVDPDEMGKLAGRLAQKILDAPDEDLERVEYVEQISVTINNKLLNKLDIQFEKNAIEDINWIK